MKNNSRIQQLRDNYKQSMMAKSDALNSLIEPLSILVPGHAAKDQLAVWREVDEFLHKLAGSSGMYGYSEIEQSARAAMSESKREDLEALLYNLNHLSDLLRR
jgi:hypothetical protein